MPIDDERRRYHRTKSTAHPKPQARVAARGELGSERRVRESLQKLQETLRSQRDKRAELLEEEEKRVEATKLAAQRARKERNEKYERLLQAFERMNRRKAEEDAEEGREKPKRVQDEEGFRLAGEMIGRYCQHHRDAREFIDAARTK